MNNNKGKSRTMTKRQSYKIAKMRQKTKQMQVSTKPESIRAVGQAIATGLSPITSTLATKYAGDVVNQQTRQKAIKPNQEYGLKTWADLLDGNPDKESGAEGAKQSGSTSVLGG